MRSRGWLKGLAVGVLAALGVVAVWPSSAAADVFPVGPVADSKNHAYCFDGSVLPGDYQVHADSMGYLDNNTVMYDTLQSCIWTGTNSRTDVVFGREDYLYDENSNRSLGLTVCFFYNTDGVRCDQNLVGISNLYIFTQWQATGFGGEWLIFNLVKTIRHEIGHTVALKHGVFNNQVDAMITGYMANYANFDPWTYTGHHIEHIDDYYT